MSDVEITSMMSGVGLNILQSRILLRILINKLGAKKFEPENMMKSLSGDMIIPKFGEYINYHETGTKPKIILFWIRDAVDIFKKETQLIIDSGGIDIYKINRIDVVVGSNYGQGLLWFPIKVLYIMNNGKRHEKIYPMSYILCKKNNGIILKIQ